MFKHGEAVTRHVWAEGVDDGYGTGPGGFTDEPWTNVGFAPAGSTERLADGSTRVITTATLYDPLARPVTAQDEFTVRGRRYTVDADASGLWRSPFTGWSPGGTVALKAVSGG